MICYVFLFDKNMSETKCRPQTIVIDGLSGLQIVTKRRTLETRMLLYEDLMLLPNNQNIANLLLNNTLKSMPKTC
jgi:hypothetical protein